MALDASSGLCEPNELRLTASAPTLGIIGLDVPNETGGGISVITGTIGMAAELASSLHFSLVLLVVGVTAASEPQSLRSADSVGIHTTNRTPAIVRSSTLSSHRSAMTIHNEQQGLTKAV